VGQIQLSVVGGTLVRRRTWWLVAAAFGGALIDRRAYENLLQ
jgi:hypothetical protein